MMEIFAKKYYRQDYGTRETFCLDCAHSIVAMDDVMDERFGGNYLDAEERTAARAILFA